MNGIRKVLFSCILAVLPMLAGPSFAAPAKLYSLQVCVGPFANLLPTTDPAYSPDPTVCATSQSQGLNQPTGPTFIQARVFNASPPKTTNSSANSIDLFVDVNWRALNTPAKPATILDNSGNWTIDVSQASHFKVSGVSPVKPQTYITAQFWVDGFSCGDGRWDVKAYTGSGFTGATLAAGPNFTKPLTSVACAQLSCNQFITAVQPQGQTSSVTSLGYILRLERGTNEDGTTGSACTSLFAYQTPLAAGKTLQTLWDKDHDDSDVAVFSYEVNLEVTPGVTTAEGKLAQMRVAWLPKTDGTPDFQPALACEIKANFAPLQYTTLVADNGDKIEVASSLGVPEVPFSIVIEQTRKLVTKVNTNTNVWFVTTPTGGTSSPPSPHPFGAPIMSTPFRIVQSADNYDETYNGYLNKIAPICIKEIKPVTGGTNEQFTAVVIDGSDGWVRIGQ